jgi:hypothetical protein
VIRHPEAFEMSAKLLQTEFEIVHPLRHAIFARPGGERKSKFDRHNDALLSMNAALFHLLIQTFGVEIVACFQREFSLKLYFTVLFTALTAKNRFNSTAYTLA